MNSVGTARRDQCEIDPAVFTRSARILMDTHEGVFGEAGDAVVARGSIDPAMVQELSQLASGAAPGRADDDEITLFKSVGPGCRTSRWPPASTRRRWTRALAWTSARSRI